MRQVHIGAILSSNTRWFQHGLDFDIDVHESHYFLLEKCSNALNFYMRTFQNIFWMNIFIFMRIILKSSQWTRKSNENRIFYLVNNIHFNIENEKTRKKLLTLFSEVKAILCQFDAESSMRLTFGLAVALWMLNTAKYNNDTAIMCILLKYWLFVDRLVRNSCM